jgi:hypothetical protein
MRSLLVASPVASQLHRSSLRPALLEDFPLAEADVAAKPVVRDRAGAGMLEHPARRDAQEFGDSVCVDETISHKM